MSAIFWIISGIILITLYFLYAGVIMKKNKVKEASAGIDVQLKKTLRPDSEPPEHGCQIYGTRKQADGRNHQTAHGRHGKFVQG